ncbi:FRG domain-containing protein [Thiobaca trueperi]|uniref:FRG domain-containing protein n=1 Tax=Thiobaca trueperi TaxID=127458 RepID=A0A4R3MUD8_9GAMM|nr:FRG domain-containing protein [Thiobaca trueperi]TCT19725.1 FRG domain-containing protein [Thiobaca trueperi]
MRQISGTMLTPDLRKHTSSKGVASDSGYVVNTYRELVEQVAKLSYLNKDFLLFFRGQANDYKNKAGKSTFYPTIYRSDYLTQQELDYRFDKLYSASKILAELFKKHKIEGQYELRRKKHIQWSILQHYEVTETPLIDVTQSIRVACSFAQLNNDQKTAFIYVFGLPYYTNRISINSEHDLINIRLLSITPPQALRPYFQEGFLVGTDDITNEYERKEELDLNNRLIAKFEIPNSGLFWGNSFDRIPEDALYPKNDEIENICKDIDRDLKTEIAPLNIGIFLKLWAELEQVVLKQARLYIRDAHNVRNAISVLLKYEESKYSLLKELDNLRMFRNAVVHKPTSINNDELNKNIQVLEKLKREINAYNS